MIKSKIIIAVDGPAGSGKSSVSREAAIRLGIKYVDSGALYRAITFHLLKRHGILDKDTKCYPDVRSIDVEQVCSSECKISTYVNGVDVSKEIRDERIAKNIGIVSDDPDIRGYVNRILRGISEKDSIIMDGRDIGTVVFPDADIKIYLDASPDVRAQRRMLEYREMGKQADLEDIKKRIIKRDEEDKSRPLGRLCRADDAIYIDTSDMNIGEVIEKIVEIINIFIKSVV